MKGMLIALMIGGALCIGGGVSWKVFQNIDISDWVDIVPNQNGDEVDGSARDDMTAEIKGAFRNVDKKSLLFYAGQMQACAKSVVTGKDARYYHTLLKNLGRYRDTEDVNLGFMASHFEWIEKGGPLSADDANKLRRTFQDLSASALKVYKGR